MSVNQYWLTSIALHAIHCMNADWALGWSSSLCDSVVCKEVMWGYWRQQVPCTNFYSMVMNNLFADGEWVRTLCQFTTTIRTASSEIKMKLWVLPSCKHQDIDRSVDVISKKNPECWQKPTKRSLKQLPSYSQFRGFTCLYNTVTVCL